MGKRLVLTQYFSITINAIYVTMQINLSTNVQHLFASLIKCLAVLLVVTAAIEILRADQYLADVIYGLEGNKWQLKEYLITETIIHKGGKYLSIALALSVLLTLISTYLFPALSIWKNRLIYLFISSVMGSVLVSMMKATSNISCPWDFERYGGSLNYLSLMEQIFVRNGSHCFPAGHASAGFAWVALYFVGLHTNSFWRWWGLGFGVTLGIIFGVSQQLRGAHFLSHDVWSFGTCWMVSLTGYHLILKPYEPIRHR
jgi:membrane-associated PAP2 superfamily phosphatase